RVVLPLGQKRRVIRDSVDQRHQPDGVFLGKVVQDVVGNGGLDAGVADADAQPAVGIAERGVDGTQSVVPGGPATRLHAGLAGRQVDLVVDDDDVLRVNLVEGGGGL